MNNSISFRLPVHLLALLRRLVHVFSSLSLSNHYLLSSRHPSDPSPPRSTLDLASTPLSLGWRMCSTSTDAETSSPPSSTNSRRPTDAQRSPGPPPPELPQDDTEYQDTIHRLMNNPTLFDPARAPRYPIVLCHGLYGFDVRGPAAFPSLRLHYWSSVLSILKHKLGAEVIVTGVPATGSIASRAENLDRILQHKARGRGVNLVAHSMGGLDCRHLITHIRPAEYIPLSLTSISTPHRGSPFMDWCAQYLGLGRRQYEPTNQRANDVQPDSDPISSTDSSGASEKRETAFRLSLSTLPSSFTTLFLSLIDSPAYANLTTSYLNDVFNPSTPNDPRVKYFSVASRIDEINIWHPLWLPKMVLDDIERKARERLKAAAENTSYSHPPTPLWEREVEWGNDGLVTIQSARWGEFLGVLNGCDHWEIRGARGMDVELPSGMGNITNRVAGEGWDWSRFIGAWRKQDKGLELAQAAGNISSETEETERIPQDDPIVKASTDKLSAVFDWIVEHVPTSGNTVPPKEKLPPKKEVRNDLATKLDLERFYVALTRKLYDDGL